jgi:hypothetical protein
MRHAKAQAGKVPEDLQRIRKRGKCDQTITCQLSELLAQRTARGRFRGSGVWVLFNRITDQHRLNLVSFP